MEPIVAKKSKLTDGAIHQRQPKTGIDALNEPIPRRGPAVDLEPVVPQLCIIQQTEHGISDVLVLRRATHAEILLAVVQPRQWITDTVELGELKFVCCGQEVTARVILLVSNDVAAWCTPRVLVLALDLLEGEVECHLLLTLFSVTSSTSRASGTGCMGHTISSMACKCRIMSAMVMSSPSDPLPEPAAEA
jgi:hypothetical protein